jgi:hypothetical protein
MEELELDSDEDELELELSELLEELELSEDELLDPTHWSVAVSTQNPLVASVKVSFIVS